MLFSFDNNTISIQDLNLTLISRVAKTASSQVNLKQNTLLTQAAILETKKDDIKYGVNGSK